MLLGNKQKPKDGPIGQPKLRPGKMSSLAMFKGTPLTMALEKKMRKADRRKPKSNMAYLLLDPPRRGYQLRKSSSVLFRPWEKKKGKKKTKRTRKPTRKPPSASRTIRRTRLPVVRARAWWMRRWGPRRARPSGASRSPLRAIGEPRGVGHFLCKLLCL